MQRVVLVNDNGTTSTGYVSSEKEEQGKLSDASHSKRSFKEYLYMGYLVVGTIAFTLGIVLTYKRLKSNN